jgi:dCTP deaminase
MAAGQISKNIGELTRVAVRVALIERSHLGQFSWPFTDAVQNRAERLFQEEELSGLGPIVHVIAEGTGYQVVDDPVTRAGTRRILVLAFPRQLKHHVLIHAIFGHELGHPAARTDDPGRIAQAVLENMQAGPLATIAAAAAWLKQDSAPLVVKTELNKGRGLPYEGQLAGWRTELFCDLFGLFLFGPAFAAAHRAELEPSSGWPDKIVLGNTTHPPYPIRRRLITAAMRKLGWDKSVTDPEDGAAHQAEIRFLRYVTEEDGDPWLSVYPDHILAGIVDEMKRIFADHSEVMYAAPVKADIVALVNRLAVGRPPILEELDGEGRASQKPVAVQHCLYSGWCAWLGREELRLEKITDVPRLKKFSFFDINRLCAQGLLQQRAIDTVAEWRTEHPLKVREPEELPPEKIGSAVSGALGRSKIIERIADRELCVSPLLSPDQIGASSIDLRMGNVVLIVRARGSSHVNPAEAMRQARARGHDEEAGLQQKHERYELRFKTPFLLHPGTLALVPTLEWVSLPDDLMGSVTARSTWAREGLSIATATMIEPGYQGIVTLELANLGEIPIALYPGLELAQISFFDVVGGTRRPRRGQFDLSFEPQQGKIAKETEYPFLPIDQAQALKP